MARKARARQSVPTPKMAARTERRRESSTVVPPQGRFFTEWTLAKIRTAERQAECGDFNYAGAFCDFLLKDDRVLAAFNSREDQLFGLKPSFDAGTEKNDAAIKALSDDWWTAYPESMLRQLLRWGLLLGVCVFRHNWTANPDHGGRLLPMAAQWPAQAIRFKDATWSALDAHHIAHPIVLGDGEWLVHLPFGEHRPWASGMWRALARWCYAKEMARADWARHSEKGAAFVGTTPPGTRPEDRRALCEDLKALGADGVIAFEEGFSVELLEITARTIDIYKSQVELADKAIAILVRGGNLTSDVQGGSRAAAETQERTGDGAKLRFDAESLTTTIHNQSLRPYAEFNFGNPRLAPWPKYPTEPEEDKEANAKLLTTAADGFDKLEKLGFQLNDKAFVERFGFGDIIKGRGERMHTAPPPGQPEPEGDDDGDKEQPSDAKAAREVLASGASAEANRGFLEGQGYVDDLVESYQGTASELLQKDLDRVLALVDSVTSYDEVEAKLAELYQGLDPQRLTEVVERFMQVADLAGRAAVRQDVA